MRIAYRKAANQRDQKGDVRGPLHSPQTHQDQRGQRREQKVQSTQNQQAAEPPAEASLRTLRIPHLKVRHNGCNRGCPQPMIQSIPSLAPARSVPHPPQLRHLLHLPQLQHLREFFEGLSVRILFPIEQRLQAQDRVWPLFTGALCRLTRAFESGGLCRTRICRVRRQTRPPLQESGPALPQQCLPAQIALYRVNRVFRIYRIYSLHSLHSLHSQCCLQRHALQLLANP